MVLMLIAFALLIAGAAEAQLAGLLCSGKYSLGFRDNVESEEVSITLMNRKAARILLTANCADPQTRRQN